MPLKLKSSFSVLFPAFKHGLREPDPNFFKETTALEAAGISIHVVNIDALMDGDLSRAFQYTGKPVTDRIVYRGWILHPGEYALMEKQLESAGFKLFTPTRAYKAGLLFPEFFPHIEPHAIPARWINGSDPNEAVRVAKCLGKPPYYIKDYAKSAKVIAPQGCIVSGDDLESCMSKTIKQLKEYRGDRFEGGIVVRPFIELRHIDNCPFGGLIYEEYRLYFLQGKIISQTAYDRVGGDPMSLPDYSYLGKLIASPFFTADIVVTAEGKHLILELGDGGTSALPPTVNPHDFYSQFSTAIDG